MADSAKSTPALREGVTGNTEIVSQTRLYPGTLWQWKHETGFRDYRVVESDRIEQAYRNGDAYVRLKSTIGHRQNVVPLEVFFYDMLQYDPVTTNRRAIRCVTRHPWLRAAMRILVILGRSVEKGKWQQFSFEQHQESKQDTQSDRLTKLEHANAHAYYHTTGYCQWMARSQFIFGVSILVVVLNAFWIGIELELNTERGSASGLQFQIPDNFFCAFFTVEILMRFGAFQKTRLCLKCGWFCFDATLAVLLICETWVVPLVLLGSGAATDERVTRRVGLLRLARLLRLAQLFRLLQFNELLTLLKGLVKAARSVCWTLLLLLVLIYMFAVIFRSFAEDFQGSLPPHFDSLGGLMQMLLLQGTFVDDVTDVLDVIYPVSPALYMAFIGFIFLSAYAVLNLLIGILCDVVSRVRQAEANQALESSLRESLFEILDVHDKDGNRTVSSNEWDLVMQNPEMHMILKRCRVNIKHLMDLKEVLFQPEGDLRATRDLSHVLSESEQGVPFDEMLEVILRLRGSTTATVSDIVDLRQYIQQRLDHLHNKNTKALQNLGDTGRMNGNWGPGNSSIIFSSHCGSTANPSMTLGSLDSTAEEVRTATRPADAAISSESSEPPAWANEILSRLTELSAKHDALHSEVATLRGQLLGTVPPQPRLELADASPRSFARPCQSELELAELRGQLIRAAEQPDHDQLLRDAGLAAEVEESELMHLPSQIVSMHTVH